MILAPGLEPTRIEKSRATAEDLETLYRGRNEVNRDDMKC